MSARAMTGALALALLIGGCTSQHDLDLVGSIRIVVTSIDDMPLPTEDAPLPPNLGDVEARFAFSAEALDAEGRFDPSFNGFARISVVPGAVNHIEGAGASGRNIRFTEGRAEGVAFVTAVFGPTRLWFEDIGYVPAQPGETPTCSNGVDDDGDITSDFPNDPGCAFADDMTEEEGSLLTGVSPLIQYAKLTVADVQGRGSTTPYPAVSVDVATRGTSFVVVTRVSSDGFYVTDLGDPLGEYNHLYAFNFNTPFGLRVCNRLGLFTGTASEFFGFTEVSFPSYEVGRIDSNATTVCERDINCDPAEDPMCCPAGQICERTDLRDETGLCQPCLIPAPRLIEDTEFQNDAILETAESGLVTIEQATISPFMGPENPPESAPGIFTFSANASNCDLNGDGRIDFLDLREAACANQCADDENCSEWIGFASRGNYKLHKGTAQIQANTGTAQGFNPLLHRGKTFAYITGTLRNFSGGTLNWTVETRCGDDIGCNFDPSCNDVLGCVNACNGDMACIYVCERPRDTARSCITPATVDDNDAGTN